MSVYFIIETDTMFNQPEIELKYILFSVYDRWHTKTLYSKFNDKCKTTSFECILFNQKEIDIKKIISDVQKTANTLNVVLRIMSIEKFDRKI